MDAKNPAPQITTSISKIYVDVMGSFMGTLTLATSTSESI
jgi:hypothetical protein